MFGSENGGNQIPDFGGGFGSPNTSASVTSPTKSQYTEGKSSNLLPLCARQIRDCPHEDFAFWGIKPQMVVLVGILRELDVQATRATFKIEDHTGDMGGILWLEDEAKKKNTDLTSLKEGSYLRIHATIRKQDGKKILMAVSMKPVKHAGEVTIHRLEVVAARLELEKIFRDKVNIGTMNNPGAALASSMSFMDTTEAPKENSTFNPLQNKIFGILKACDTDMGVSTSDVLSKFPSGQHREVRMALEFLLNEGHAYTTVDIDHYKVTESM